MGVRAQVSRCGAGALARSGVVLAAVLVVASTAMARVHEDKHEERRRIEQMEEQIRVAEIAGDVPALDRMLSDDFVGISMSGEVNTKAQQLARIQTHALVLSKIHLDDVKIKLLGTVAVVTSRERVEGAADGRSLSGTYRYTRVYLRVAGDGWKVTNFEVTRISA